MLSRKYALALGTRKAVSILCHTRSPGSSARRLGAENLPVADMRTCARGCQAVRQTAARGRVPTHVSAGADTWRILTRDAETQRGEGAWHGGCRGKWSLGNVAWGGVGGVLACRASRR